MRAPCRWRWIPTLARAIADRRTGVGCDQLILLEPSAAADVKMRIFNHDGSEVGACGNAARCVVLLTGPVRIETDGGIIDGGKAGDEVEVAMGEPRFEWDSIPLAYAMDTAALPMAWDALESPMAVNVGNPHLVFFVDDVSAVPLDELGPRIEHDAAFPERINVNVAAVEGDGSAPAHLGTRCRPHSRLRHRRLRHRGRGHRFEAGHFAGPRHHAWRHSDDRLGSGQPHPDAGPGDPRVRRDDRSGRASPVSVETITLGLPPQLRRKRGDATQCRPG